MMKTSFKKAKPIWIKDKQNEMHIRAIFRTSVGLENDRETWVKIATSGIYNLYINGAFVSYGPARAGKGHFRMDCIDITPYVKKGQNLVVIEVAGYNVNSYYIMNQPSFLQAEIVEGDRVVSYTGDDLFEGAINPYLIRKVQRYSFQRPMIEAYNLEEGYEQIYTDLSRDINPEELEIQEDKTIIERYAPYPQYEVIEAKAISSGSVDIDYPPENIHRDRSYKDVGPTILGFKPEELEFSITD